MTTGTEISDEAYNLVEKYGSACYEVGFQSAIENGDEDIAAGERAETLEALVAFIHKLEKRTDK